MQVACPKIGCSRYVKSGIRGYLQLRCLRTSGSRSHVILGQGLLPSCSRHRLPWMAAATCSGAWRLLWRRSCLAARRWSSCGASRSPSAALVSTPFPPRLSAPLTRSPHSMPPLRYPSLFGCLAYILYAQENRVCELGLRCLAFEEKCTKMGWVGLVLLAKMADADESGKRVVRGDQSKVPHWTIESRDVCAQHQSC